MKFILLSIEFDAGTFSGNGVYACSQARALSQLGHQVLVIAGALPGYITSNGTAELGASASGQGQRVLHVELPVWGRLDAGCSWREYAAGAGTSSIAAEVATFGAAAVLGVDWHSVAAYGALSAALLPGSLPPFVYLNYRVYHRTAAPDELPVIEAQERRALSLSCCSLVLSRSDAQYLRQHLSAAKAGEAAGGTPLHVLLPALRSDMELLPPPQLPRDAAAAVTAWGAARRHLSCCVRVSPEKEPHRFVELLEELSRRGSLQRLGLVPAMCGAGWDSPYGQELFQRMQQVAPQCVIHNTFLGPTELAALYSATLLNLHPPTYDAYGMTVVEAASQGAPSLVQEGGNVGATDLLSSEAEEVFVCAMGQPISQLADHIEALLADRAKLAQVGQRAQAKARSWVEQDNARALVRHVQEALALTGGATGAATAGGKGCGQEQAAVPSPHALPRAQGGFHRK